MAPLDPLEHSHLWLASSVSLFRQQIDFEIEAEAVPKSEPIRDRLTKTYKSYTATFGGEEVDTARLVLTLQGLGDMSASLGQLDTEMVHHWAFILWNKRCNTEPERVYDSHCNTQ